MSFLSEKLTNPLDQVRWWRAYREYEKFKEEWQKEQIGRDKEPDSIQYLEASFEYLDEVLEDGVRDEIGPNEAKMWYAMLTDDDEDQISYEEFKEVWRNLDQE